MEKKNSLMSFEGKEVEVFEFNGKVLFNSRHVGECLELENSSIRKAIGKMNNKQVVKLKNSDVKDMHIRKLNNAGESFLTESGVYKLIFKSYKEEAEKFQDWVTDEVLPSIRQNGAYISNDITEEQENKLDKYSTTKKIKNTFKSCNIENIEDEFKECMNYNKNKDGKEKNNIQKNIINALEDRKQDLIDNSKGSFALVISECISNIKKKQLETNNKSRGQKLFYREKIIKTLYEEVSSLKDTIEEHKSEIEYLNPSMENYTVINYHALSNNNLHEDITDEWTGKRKKVRTKQYNIWIKYFPTYELKDKEDLDIDWNKPIAVFLKFDYVSKGDLQNLEKSIIDQVICRTYGEDDKIVKKIIVEGNETVDNYKDGKIYIYIKNI